MMSWPTMMLKVLSSYPQSQDASLQELISSKNCWKTQFICVDAPSHVDIHRVSVLNCSSATV